MADANVVGNLALARVYDAHAQTHAAPDAVAEEPAVERALQEARHRRDERERREPEFAAAVT